MFEYKTPEVSEYESIAKMINTSDKVYSSVYNDEEMKYIGLLNESANSLLEMSKNREFRVLYKDSKLAWFLSFHKNKEDVVWLSLFYIAEEFKWQWIWTFLMERFESEIFSDKVSFTIAFEVNKKADFAVKFYLKSWFKIASEDEQKKDYLKALSSE